MVNEDSASIHIGHLEQKLKRIGQQIEHLKTEVEGLETLPITSQLSSQDSVEELGYSLRAEMLRLQHELDLCESELIRNKAQSVLRIKLRQTMLSPFDVSGEKSIKN